jgi:CcmD family protein
MIRLLWACAVVGLVAGSSSGFDAADHERARAAGQVASIAQGGQPPPQQQEEFVPIDQLPPEDQLPAAPMVVAAYAFIWIAFIAYVVTLVKRIQRVEKDLRSLEQGRR